MLRDPLLVMRYARRLDRLCELGERGGRADARTTPPSASSPEYYRDRFFAARAAFHDRYQRDLVGAFRRLQDRGPASRSSPAARRTASCRSCSCTRRRCGRRSPSAAAHYRRTFGRDPVGIWLPECGYFPGVEQFLAEEGIRYFFVDTHGITDRGPAPALRRLRADPHARRRRRLRPRPRIERAGLERRAGLSRRSRLPRVLSRHRLGPRLELHAQLHPGHRGAQERRLQVLPHHRQDRAQGALRPVGGPGTGRRARRQLHVQPRAADRASTVGDESPAGGGLALRRRALRPLVVRGAGIPGVSHSQVRLRSEGLPAGHRRRISCAR